MHSGMPCTLSRKNLDGPISLRGPCSKCNERRCRTHCRCGRNSTAVGRAAGRPSPTTTVAPLPKAKAKGMPKAIGQPPQAAPVVVQRPVGRMPDVSVERLQPNAWYCAMIEAVKDADEVFSGTYQFDHTLLNDVFIQRLGGKKAFDLVLLVDKECFGNGTPPRQRTMLNNLRRAGAEIVLCRGTVSTGSFHGKALVVNRRTAFVGSANLTQKSERNGELCWRMRGPPVLDVLEYLEEERQRGAKLE